MNVTLESHWQYNYLTEFNMQLQNCTYTFNL